MIYERDWTLVSGSEKERKSRRHGGGFRRGRVHDEEGNSDLSGRRKYERENKRGTSLEMEEKKENGKIKKILTIDIKLLISNGWDKTFVWFTFPR